MSQPRPTESPFEENGTADPFLLGRIPGSSEGQDLKRVFALGVYRI